MVMAIPIQSSETNPQNHLHHHTMTTVSNNNSTGASLAQILEQTISPDHKVSVNASKTLTKYAEENLALFLLELSKEIANENNSQITRQAACFCLKNNIAMKDEVSRKQLHQRWLQIQPEYRNQIKSILINTLGSNYKEVANTTAIAISSIAQAEIPQEQWPELIPSLLENSNSPQAADNLRIATLTCIGYVCDELSSRFLKNFSDQILSAVVSGMEKNTKNPLVRLAGVKALLNSVDFIENNFSVKHERDYIMRVVCEATQSEEVDIVDFSLQTLARMVDKYYECMSEYMHSLFEVTVQGMNSKVEKKVLQSIEFWCTVCEREDLLEIEIADAQQQGIQPPANMNYGLGAMPHLVKILPLLMTKQEDDPDKYTIAKAAAVCLQLLATICQDKIVDEILPFVTGNIGSQDWHYKEAAVLAFGTIMEGPSPEKLKPLVEQALSPLVNLLKDPHELVRDSTAWVLGTICKILPEIVLSDNICMNFLGALFNSMNDQPSVVNHLCWAFKLVCEKASEDKEEGVRMPTFALSRFYNDIIMKLLDTTERSDASENNLRTAAYEAIMMFISKCPDDCYETLKKVTLEMLLRMDNVVQRKGNSQREHTQLSEVQSLICATLRDIVIALNPEDVKSLADRLMKMMMYVFRVAHDNKQDMVQEDAIATIQAMVDQLDTDFVKYMPAFKEYIEHGLTSYSDYKICRCFIECVSDIARVLGPEFMPYSDMVMNKLSVILHDPKRNPSLLPVTLACFGDICDAIKDKFAKYAEHVFDILGQVSQTQYSMDTYEEVDFWNILMDSVLVCYSNIIIELMGTHKQAISKYVPTIMGFLEKLLGDSNVFHVVDVNRSACGIVGDLLGGFQREMRPFIVNKPWIQQNIRTCMHATDDNYARENAIRTNKYINHLFPPGSQ